MKQEAIAIVGAGSWGTAVAIHLAKQGNHLLLWGHNPQHIQVMIQEKCNQRYLPNVAFPPTLKPTANLTECLAADYLIIAVPSHAFAEILAKIEKPARGLIWLTKGVNPSDNQLFSDMVAEQWGKDYPVAMLSGPSFAKEVAQSLPTALTLVSNNKNLQTALQLLFHQQNLRIYLSHDLVGVQLCGAIKNVLAIACGISDGLSYGANAKAALITRGLAEMTRLGKAYGAQEATFMGLAGVGDLVLTCTDNQSRNRRFGLLVGKGENIDAAELQISQVVEGKHNARQVCNLARQVNVEMPICLQIELLLNNQTTAEQAVKNLMNRAAKAEI